MHHLEKNTKVILRGHHGVGNDPGSVFLTWDHQENWMKSMSTSFGEECRKCQLTRKKGSGTGCTGRNLYMKEWLFTSEVMFACHSLYIQLRK